MTTCNHSQITRCTDCNVMRCPDCKALWAIVSEHGTVRFEPLAERKPEPEFGEGDFLLEVGLEDCRTGRFERLLRV